MLALGLGWITLAWADATLEGALAKPPSERVVAAVPTVGASEPSHSSDLRVSERVELLGAEQRGFGRDHSSGFTPAYSTSRPDYASCLGCGDWTERLQRRRVAGEQIALFANPPPHRDVA